MEKIQANMCLDVYVMYKNIGTCLFTPLFLYFLHLVLPFTPPLHHNGRGSIIISLGQYTSVSQDTDGTSKRINCSCTPSAIIM